MQFPTINFALSLLRTHKPTKLEFFGLITSIIFLFISLGGFLIEVNYGSRHPALTIILPSAKVVAASLAILATLHIARAIRFLISELRQDVTRDTNPSKTLPHH